MQEVRLFIEQYHYSKNINGVKISQCFKATNQEKLYGAMLFGQLSTTAWKKFAEKESEVLELRRLVMLDTCLKYSESRFIGFCLRWIKKEMPWVKVLCSYADPMYGHAGVIYKATNFVFDGMTPDDKGFYNPITGKTYHSRALRTKYKGDYKPFVKKLRKMKEEGLLKETVLKGKYRYIFKF